jgi:hypothetical protein
MVEKRTFVFVILATIVWASLASAFAGYYYLQNTNTSGQLSQAQNSLDKVTSNCNTSVEKYDQLFIEYSSIHGTNYTRLMPTLGNLITHLGENYTSLFTQEDLNKTYSDLLKDYNTLKEGNVTSDNFGKVLTEFYSLFNLCALRDLSVSISNATTLSVSILFDYGNGTQTWHNRTRISIGYTLFQLTLETAVINYSYYPSGPGHIFVDSINNKAPAGGYYWSWYYWNDDQKAWVLGQVGCDARTLKDGGIYRWKYEIPTF